MASLNITSLLKHIDELRVFLNDQNIDVLAIIETRLNEGIFDQEVKVQGYDIIRRDRSKNGRLGGGVCFYIGGRNVGKEALSLYEEMKQKLEHTGKDFTDVGNRKKYRHLKEIK